MSTGAPLTGSIHSAASRCLRIAFGLYVGVVLALLLIWAPHATYACKSPWIQYGAAIFAAAFGCAIALICVCNAARRRLSLSEHGKKAGYRAILAVGLVVLVVAQCAAIAGGMFATGWDVKILTDFGNYGEYAPYYSRYTNQWFLVGAFNLISNIGSSLGVDNGYLCVVVVGCTCADASVLLTTLTARALFGRFNSCLLFALEIAFVGLNAWIFVPYSDTYAMAFTSAILFAYVCCRKPLVKWPAIAFFTVLGYAVKPTVLFALLAILAVEVIWGIGKLRGRDVGDLRATAKAVVGSCAPIVVAVALSALIASAMVSAVSIDENDFDYNPNLQYGATHFLMMGFNPETLGIWNGDDVMFSYHAPTVEARREGNLRVFFERLDAYGPLGVLGLLAKKSMSNLGDGTLAWEQEGDFYRNTYGNSELVKTLYGIDDAVDSQISKSRDPLFAPFACVLWFAILIGLVLSMMAAAPDKRTDVIRLSLLVLLVFLMVFECRARYLVLYLPYFMILSMAGWRAFANWARAARLRRGKGQTVS